jgi:hypothetical protein
MVAAMIRLDMANSRLCAVPASLGGARFAISVMLAR